MIKRVEDADSEILKLTIDFCCLYQMEANHALFAFEIFFKGESFILAERLMIMKELNQKFNQVPEIVALPLYWDFIKKGLCDLDNYCRKLALAIL